MQDMAINWRIFGGTLAGAFVFGLLFASLVRWASGKQWIGQTAWAVVIGVSVTLIIMIPVLGIQVVATAFAYFGATGLPMIVEYILRVQEENKRDHERARAHAKDLLSK